MGQVRAKYRVLWIKKGWDKSHRLEAAPIMPRTKDWPQEENSVENAAFWEATPSGKLDMTFTEGHEPPWKPDEAILIYMEPAEEGWKLYKVGLYEDQLEIIFYPQGAPLPEGCVSAEFSMLINNQGAWPPFKEAGPGSRWKITFTRAAA